jgi:RHS repeat-associated protein
VPALYKFLATLAYNLRFPGQYYQAETGLNQNYFRDYDSAVGRYVESDPIGLKGGINTYGYVGGNPIGSVDSMGLVLWRGLYNYTAGGVSKFGGGVSAVGYTFVLKSDCVGGKRATVVVNALADSVGFGGSIFGPIALGASGVTFDDHLTTLNPDVFNGSFTTTNFGTFFASFTVFSMGNTVGNGSGFNVSTSGLDVSGARGTSHLTKPPRIESCDCAHSQP